MQSERRKVLLRDIAIALAIVGLAVLVLTLGASASKFIYIDF